MPCDEKHSTGCINVHVVHFCVVLVMLIVLHSTYMQGGPGCASTFGLLYELGPLLLTDDLQLLLNPGEQVN